MTAEWDTEADFDDGQDDDGKYEGAKYSCSVVIRKTVLFLGGFLDRSQISQLTPVGLIRIGTLPFTFFWGTCHVIGRKLFLGFEVLRIKSCWSRYSALNYRLIKKILVRI